MPAAGSGENLKVFISYSRRDSGEFVDELVVGLELVGFAPFIDRHDIAAGEKWEDRLGGLIDQADTVVFVVSPDAVKSERCAWEVERTLQKSKRLLPVVFKSVPEADIPEGLRERQFVRFDTGPGITRPLGELAQALRQDIDWTREHTRIGELAQRWDVRGRPESLLLRGDDVAAVQAWVERRKADAPGITDLMRGFIAASKAAEKSHATKSRAAQRRVRLAQGLAAICAAAFATGVIAWWNQDWLRERAYAMAKVTVLTTAQERALKPKDSFKECTDCPEMIVVPAGKFTMGSPGTEKEHGVTIAKPFAVSKFELTFSEWDACVAHGDCVPHVVDSGWGRGRQPAINVNWDDAQGYVAWLSRITDKTYRLLSEAEYEYAARAGTQTVYPWGDDIGYGNANCSGCNTQWSNKQTAPIGSFAANGYGLYDMVGNVWEWTEDCYHNSYNGAPVDGTAWTGDDCSTRVVRGGAWDSHPPDLRSAARGMHSADGRLYVLGFRVGRTLITLESLILYLLYWAKVWSVFFDARLR
jgi:formylglycine-generating enzyme required for sulfatase activity